MHGINQQFDYDLAVVGGGSAGYAAARPPRCQGFAPRLTSCHDNLIHRRSDFQGCPLWHRSQPGRSAQCDFGKSVGKRHRATRPQPRTPVCERGCGLLSCFPLGERSRGCCHDQAKTPRPPGTRRCYASREIPIGGYRLENWKRLRAPGWPDFLRSFIRGSRVR